MLIQQRWQNSDTLGFYGLCYINDFHDSILWWFLSKVILERIAGQVVAVVCSHASSLIQDAAFLLLPHPPSFEGKIWKV